MLFVDIDSASLVLEVNGNSNDTLVTATIAGTDLSLTYLPDQNGSAQITIRASADGQFVDEVIDVMVNSINDAPVFTSPATFEFNDGETDVGQASASDVDMDAVTFMFSGGDDVALFDITVDGLISFLVAPDVENPLDFDGDNEYQILVQAFDGVDTTEQAVTVLPSSTEDCTFFTISIVNSKAVVVCL
jgi:hypothetical protein